MATQDAFRVTEDTSARKGTRVSSIQSAIEAAAAKESHDFFVTRLTEGYKQQLETMEQEYEESIGILVSQQNEIIEKAKQDALRAAKVEVGEQLSEMKNKLGEMAQELSQSKDAMFAARKREKTAVQEKGGLETRYRTQVRELNEKHQAELDKAQREKTSGPYRWIGVKFYRKYKTKLGEPKEAVKRASATFDELALAATGSKTTAG